MKVKTKTLKLKALDEAGRGLAVFATLEVIDKDGDVTRPGAFGEQLVKLLPAHDWGHVPLGKARIFESGNEALAEFALNLDIEAARDWHAALKFDLADGAPLQEWSYGFDVTKASFGELEGQRVRFLEGLKVHEVSPVVLGAGVGTRTLTVKGARGRKLAEHIAAAREELADLAERVRELKAAREAEGRGISTERLAELLQVKAALESLAPLAAEIGALGAAGDAGAEEARKLFSRYTAISAGLKEPLKRS